MSAVNKRGIVWIAPNDPVSGKGAMIDPATAEFWASWQDEPEGVLANEEFVGAESAIAWARQRAAVVFIRLGHGSGTYFSAGEEFDPDAWSSEEPLPPPWPPSGPPAAGWWTRPPAPTRAEVVSLIEQVLAGQISRDEAESRAASILALLDPYQIDDPVIEHAAFALAGACPEQDLRARLDELRSTQ
jgi:hypothetical protein